MKISFPTLSGSTFTDLKKSKPKGKVLKLEGKKFVEVFNKLLAC